MGAGGRNSPRLFLLKNIIYKKIVSEFIGLQYKSGAPKGARFLIIYFANESPSFWFLGSKRFILNL
jgi:hypothetical protein